VAVPSALLERRPDIANAERLMAAQNEQIGIAMAAFYPTIGLGGTAGLQGTSLLNVFSWPSRFWSLGPSASQLIYDAGRRRAILPTAAGLFDSSVASYRQTVLTAFQQVEDALSALRILESESDQVKEAWTPRSDLWTSRPTVQSGNRQLPPGHHRTDVPAAESAHRGGSAGAAPGRQRTAYRSFGRGNGMRRNFHRWRASKARSH